MFEQYGAIDRISIIEMPGSYKCGFVHYRRHEHAKQAVETLHGNCFKNAQVVFSKSKKAQNSGQAQKKPKTNNNKITHYKQ
jgi:RNA recognition motif-containing protein